MKPTSAVETLLEGVLIPAAWGPSGEVIEVGLVTFDEAEYRIERDAVWDRWLRDHLRQRVRLWVALASERSIRLHRVELPGWPITPS